METNANSNGSAEEHTTTVKKKSSKKWKWIVLIVVLLIVGWFGYIYFSYQSDVPNETFDGDDYATAIYSPVDGYMTRLTIEEYSKMDESYQRGMINFLNENDRGDGEYYFMTSIPERAKNVYCFGNFSDRTNAKDLDIAFIAENSDFKNSRLVIMDMSGNILYTNEMYGLPVINAFKKGAKIFRNKYVLEPSDVDGIIVQGDGSKYVYAFDKKTKQFQSYYQYTKEEIDAYNNPSEGDYEDEGEPEKTIEPEKVEESVQ